MAKPASKAIANHACAIPRLDARAKVTGGARFAADIVIDNLAYAVLVTSAIATGRISKIKLDVARAVPGVLTILTYKDGETLKRLKSIPDIEESEIRPLKSWKVWHDGQIVALVVAETLEAAREGASQIEIAYKEKRPSATFGAAGTKTRAAREFGFPDYKDLHHGHPALALRASAVKVDATYETTAQHHNAMELFSTTCIWHHGRLTIYEPSQFVYGLRRAISDQLRIKFAKVRVISPFVGGGFGGKAWVTARTALTAIAARRLGRPVRLVASRDQGFTTAGYRAETKHRIRLGARRDGKLQALIHEGWELCSRQDAVFWGGIDTTCRMYAAANVRGEVSVVHADRNMPGFMRAPAEFPYVFALETAMDELAVNLRMDPIELRRINDTTVDPIGQAPYSSRSLMRCFDRAAKVFGWRHRNPHPGAMRDGDWFIGWGCASAIYPTQMQASAARVTLARTGTVLVEIAAHELGTGAMTAIAEGAAERLGVAAANVQVNLGDSALPPGPMAAGSATTASACSAVLRACDAINEKLAEIDPAKSLDAAFRRLRTNRIVRYAVWLPFGLDSDARRGLHVGEFNVVSGNDPSRGALTFAFGAEFVEVRVHAMTCEIRVPRIVGAFAAGRIMNARAARSQLMGGMIWGIGSALHEQTEIDTRRARYINDNIADYLVPVSADIADVEVILMPEHDPTINPAGVKGLGELGNVGTAAAISNAVFHATGKRIRKLPIRIEHLL
jgi:xanthine dehydrogenase YagR molybdenum-binding subunit